MKQLIEVAPRGALLVGIGRPDYADVDTIDAVVRSRGMTVVNAAGLEPGLAEILGAHAVASLDRPRALHLRCGGIPVAPQGPFPYKRLFGGKYLPFERRPTFAFETGALVAVDRFSDVESVVVEGVGTLEAWHDGLVPWLVGRDPFCRLETLTQKTLRWPGYASTVSTLHALGLLSHTPIDVEGAAVVPWEVVHTVMRPMTEFTRADADCVVLTATALGAGEQRCTLELVDRFDSDTGLTAMARTTGFACSLMVEALVETDDVPPGYLSPEAHFQGARAERLFERLRDAGVVVRTNHAAAPPRRDHAMEARHSHA
jgi:lysine 6-dehydrogenase